MKKISRSYLFIIAGIILVITGLYFIKAVTEPKGFMQALPYVFMGIGCGMFGQGTGNIIGKKAVANRPEIEKQIEIDQNDERNIAIGNKAKAKAYDMMIYVFGGLLLAFALMGQDLYIILLMALAYLFVICYGVYYRVKYERQM
jgi:hypothetical protein